MRSLPTIVISIAILLLMAWLALQSLRPESLYADPPAAERIAAAADCSAPGAPCPQKGG